jgi:hypothetical protein
MHPGTWNPGCGANYIVDKASGRGICESERRIGRVLPGPDDIGRTDLAEAMSLLEELERFSP